ncbi:MAG: glycosyltransferase [Coriobacteriales bacterium]|nr:glycosyltransferase [Coriobacteriales bacterium]
MRFLFNETTRGRGKIFVHVTCPGLPEDVRVTASSVTKKGDPVPAKVLQVPNIEGWVVIVPVLSLAQIVTVVATDDDGSVLVSNTKTLAPFASTMQSRINTARHDEVAETIRNCDIFLRPRGVVLMVREYVPCDYRDGCDVMRATLVLSSFNKEEAFSPLEFRLLSMNGTNIAIGDIIDMGEKCSKDISYEHVKNCSVVLPHEIDELIIWAHCPYDPSLDSFYVFEDFYIDELRRNWRLAIEPADVNAGYDEWLRVSHRSSLDQLALQRDRVFEDGPSFSIIVPLYRTPLNFLREMADSVLDQTYSNLELVLVNASPDDVALCQEVATYAARDERVRVVTMEENLGISGNTMAGIEAATGDFICFFDHDDVLEPDILYYYADAVDKHPTIDMLYCDEDKLLNGRFISPFFKPDWSPDLLTSENYVCHMLCVRAEIAKSVPEEYLQCDGAQDHFLTFYAGERARKVFHVRRVLYHWRIHEQSTAASGEAKTYTSDSGIRALQAHLDRCGIAATARARGVVPNTYAIDYKLPEHPLVSIVIPNKDLVPVLSRCVNSIRDKSTYDNYEIVIVENNSTNDETFAYYKEVQADKRVRVVMQESDGTFNFSRTINCGVAASRGEYLLFLNNDTEVITPEWIERLLGPCQREDVGAVGAKLIYPDGLLQHAGVVFHRSGPFHIAVNLESDTRAYYNMVQLTQNVSAVTGACLMVSKKDFDLVDGFDEDLAVDYNDIDFCLKLRDLGRLVVYEPLVELYHYESLSRGTHNNLDKMMDWAECSGKIMTRYPQFYADGDPYWSEYFQINPYRKFNPAQRGPWL